MKMIVVNTKKGTRMIFTMATIKAIKMVVPKKSSSLWYGGHALSVKDMKLVTRTVVGTKQGDTGLETRFRYLTSIPLTQIR